MSVSDCIELPTKVSINHVPHVSFLIDKLDLTDSARFPNFHSPRVKVTHSFIHSFIQKMFSKCLEILGLEILLKEAKLTLLLSSLFLDT